MTEPIPIKPSGTVYLASFGALLGALSMGLALGYTAPAFLDMSQNNQSSPLDPDEAKAEREKSMIASALAIGALVGGILVEPSNKLLGRRISLIVYGAPFVLGWLLIAFANSVTLIVLGRLLTGLCCGLASGTAPTYVVEIAPPKIRGLLGTCFQVMVVIGILFAAVFAKFLAWNSLAGWSVIPAIGMSAIMFYMPETPQWLLSKGLAEEAESSLARLRISQISQELATMSQSAQQALQAGSQYSWAMVSSKEFYKPFLLALGLMFFQQFSGINAVLFYQTDIFKAAAPKTDALLSTIFVCLAQVIATVIGSFLVDLLGRRVLLVISGAGHTVSLILFGWYSHKSAANADFQTAYAWVAVTSIIAFVSSFSLGYGPVPWMMIPELSSARVRSLVASIATAFNWTCVFVVTVTVKSMISSMGVDKTYWFYSIICALSCIFVLTSLPETKGKSSEQIQAEMLGAGATYGVHNQNQSRSPDEPMKTLA